MPACVEAPGRGGSNNGGRPRHGGLEGARHVSSVSAAPATVRLPGLMPAVIAALSFSTTDILLKVAYASGMDVLTLASLRAVLAAVFFWTWLRIVPPVRWHTARQRAVAMGIGVLFALSVIGLLEAVALLPVSIAILAYFIYPLLTGIAAALTGVERLGPRAMLAATVAFIGLALMLGVSFGGLSAFGLACAFGAALCRVASLLATRAFLSGTDARVTTWYSMVPSAVLFVTLSLVAGVWGPPPIVQVVAQKGFRTACFARHDGCTAMPEDQRQRRLVLYQSAERLTLDTGLSPSWWAKARHPCLWLEQQKA